MSNGSLRDDSAKSNNPQRLISNSRLSPFTDRGLTVGASQFTPHHSSRKSATSYSSAIQLILAFTFFGHE